MTRWNPTPAHVRVLDRASGYPSPEACWVTGLSAATSGHAQVRDGPRLVMAHRAVYEALVGPVPEGHVLHHSETCDKRCVNPAHLAPLTAAEHNRLHSTRDTCAKGHPFDTHDARQRVCSVCRRNRWRAWKARQT